jgi:uncharacterized repeat protein (TIGR01451 family)/LPXTG-motif cell wall-anchored protein
LAFAATFLLLTAGGVVTHPSLISAGSGTHTSGGSGGDDSSGNHDGGDDSGHHHGDDDCTSHDGHDDGHNGDGGHHDGNDDGKDDGKDDGSHDDGNDDGSHDSNDDNSGDHSGDDQANDGSSKDGSSDQSVSAATFNGSHPSNGGSDGTNSGDGSHDDGKDDDGNDDGSHHDGNDDGSHDGSHDDGNDDGNDDDDDCATATLILNKLVTNDDGGTATIADFTLKATSDTGTDVISGVDPDPSTAVGVQAKVDTAHTYVLSEAGPDGYEASAWDCSAGTLDGDTLTLAEGDVATCTITNDDTPTQPQTAIITVYKIVDNGPWGGTLQKSDFQLQIDGADVAQEVPVEVAPGTHTLSEVQRSGYQLAAIICVQHGTDTIVSTGESVDVVAGEAVDCVFGNAALPAMLTVRKFIDPRNGGDLTSSDFQLQIDGANVSQNEALALAAGTHTVGEVAVPGYQMVGISCSDDDTQTSVAYDNGVALALGQHVTCNVTNVADPVDLAITKVDDGQSHVAGGAPFDYTITVDNLGPRDASITDSVTVTDRLPAGLEFVTYPDTCTPSGQDLVCDIDPADLEVADPPVEIVVTVKAAASAAAGTYTNLAFVDTPDDPACVGTDCAPSCDTNSNNIACVDTDITRGATVTIDKSDNVDSVHPGDTYAYTVTVGNSGPSTMLDLAVTDDLPEGLILQSVSAAAPWSCNNADPVSCSYNEPLDPGDSAPAITINVKVDPAFLGTSIVNEASVVAVVTAKTALDPGTVSTAKDDETTPVVRSADLTIDKSVSKTTAAIGEEFDWVLDVTNHGPDTATNVAIHDAMPAAFQVKTVTPTGASCTNTASSVDCTIASLANGGTAKVVGHVVVVATATTGATSNTATVGSDTADPNSADNSDTASISVTPATASQAPVPPASGGSNSGSPSLPRTGNGSLGAPLTLAGLLLAGGMFSLVIARRRRAATAK